MCDISSAWFAHCQVPSMPNPVLRKDCVPSIVRRRRAKGGSHVDVCGSLQSGELIKTRYLILVSATAVLLGVTAGCGGSARGSADAAKVARAYVEDYNRRDGEAMCAAFTGALRDWFERVAAFRPGLRCPRIVAGMIGYGEESDTPTFRRLEVLSVHPHVSGRSARVEVEARYHYEAYPKPLASVFTDEIYLLDRGGRWQVSKPGAVYFLTQSAYSSPASVLDPPLGDAEAHKAAPQPAAPFRCNPERKPVMEDPAGDAPRGLDLRAASASVNDGGTVCLRFSFVGPPRPGTDLEVQIEQPAHLPTSTTTTRLTDLSMRIGSRGRFYFTVNGSPDASRLFAAGWRNGRLELLWKQPERGPVRFTASTKTLQPWEPLVHHPMTGLGDEPLDGRGDSLETP